MIGFMFMTVSNGRMKDSFGRLAIRRRKWHPCRLAAFGMGRIVVCGTENV